MRKCLLLVAAVLFLVIAYPALAKGKTKIVIVAKSGWIDDFEVGHSELQAQQYAAIKQVVRYLQQHPQVRIVLKGSVSDEKIKRGYCFASDDFLYFSLDKWADNSYRYDSESLCENLLGQSRLAQVKREMIRQGIKEEGIMGFTEVDVGNRPGSHSQNRAVSYWYVEVPNGAKLKKASEDNGGNLVATFILPTFCDKFHLWLQDIKEKFPRPKSRLKEKYQHTP